jgi:hypothetical protein
MSFHDNRLWVLPDLKSGAKNEATAAVRRSWYIPLIQVERDV